MLSCMLQGNQPHRYYHNENHVNNMLFWLDKQKERFNEDELEILRTVIHFHDAVYDPRRDDNEKLSVELLKKTRGWRYAPDIMSEMVHCILATDPRTYVTGSIRNKLVDTVRELDAAPFYYNDLTAMIRNFKLILKEYQFVPYEIFKENHLKFFIQFATTIGTDRKTIVAYQNFVQAYVPRIGIYVGSFNPYHIGHDSVLQQADEMFDKVIVATPSEVKAHWTTVPLSTVLPFHEVHEFEGLLASYIKKMQGQYENLTIIRGLRDGNDLSFEINLKKSYRDLQMKVPVIYLTADNFEHVSSTMVRAVADADIEKYGWHKMYIPNRFDYAHYKWWNEYCDEYGNVRKPDGTIVA